MATKQNFILSRYTKYSFYPAAKNHHFITLHKIIILSRCSKSSFYHAAQNHHLITLQKS
jgi:hypothetical protein